MRATAAIVFALFSLDAYAAVGVRVIFGLTDQAEVKWDGSAAARGGHIATIEPWRFEGTDALRGNSWTASTHPVRLFGGRGLFGNVAQIPHVANGVVIYLDDSNENTSIDITTAQGNFAIRLADIPYGKVSNALNNRVMVDRIPPVKQLTRSPEEQDYPAAVADKSGNVWIAYIEFKHNPDHNRLRANPERPITDFSSLKAPTGGDQVMLMKIVGGLITAGEPIAVTPGGGDLYRPAIAIDGSGRVWVFWSQNDKGNFDVWARVIDDGKPGATVRISNAPGSDVDAVATTDSQGRVWVAWQGWRNGKATIFGAMQNGNRFSSPAAVSSSSANEWNPAIAADASGHVTVAWDSYRNGNYDVYMRTANSGAWGAETPVAASARYEAYPSIAYDPSGRLWVAFEIGGERWGKDFGAYDTTGLALYQGRAVGLIGFENGRVIATAVDPATALPGIAAVRVDVRDRQSGAGVQWLAPDPNNAKTRPDNAASRNVQAPKNTSPRLHIDSSGRIWLAVRSNHPIWWNPIGTVWSEYVVSYDGSQWTGPIFLSHTDNILDNRPALVSTRPGELLVVGSADDRRHFHKIEKYSTPTGINPSVPVDPFNNDLYSNLIALSPASGSMSVISGLSLPPPADASVASERSDVALLRGYRKGNLRIVRGEFHRHSEISMDGGNDGSILEQWRYAIDTAALDWVGCCDHDNGAGREYTWWITQKLTDIFYNPGQFSPMFNYERSVVYPEGHRNVIFAQRGVRVLPRLPVTQPDQAVHAPDTMMLYAYLKYFNGVTASHTSGTLMGTDWRDNDMLVEPAVEIYQGDRQNYEMPDAPRSNSEKDSIGGWRPKGFIDLALAKGYKLSFEASSDHVSTHISYANIYVTGVNREAVLDGFKKRHLYAATDNILADVSSGRYMMGDQFSTSSLPSLQVKLTGTAPFSKVYIVKDGKYVYTREPKTAKVDFSWQDMAAEPGKMSYYYVRGEQENGEVVWASPMWITYNK